MIKIIADSHIPLVSTLFAKPYFQCQLVDELTHDAIKDAEGLICRSTTKVNQALLEGTSIQYVLSATSGTDHIDKAYLKDNQITCIDAKGGNAQSVCDYVLSLIAARTDQLNGKTVGIIGVGEVGKRVKLALTHLGFSVKLCDPIRAHVEKDFEHTQLDEMAECDVITLHVPYTLMGTFSTHHLIDAAFLSKLKSNTLLINTSRGGVIDETAVLNNRKPIMLCLDVYEEEPLPSPAILSYCDSATPHIAGHAVESKHRSTLIIYRSLCSILGIPPQISPYDKLLTTQVSPSSLEAYNEHYSSKNESEKTKMISSKSDFYLIRQSHIRHECSYIDHHVIS